MSSHAKPKPQNYRLPKIAPDIAGLMKILAKTDPELSAMPAAVDAMASIPFRYGEYLVYASAPGVYSATYERWGTLFGLLMGLGPDVSFYGGTMIMLGQETRENPAWRRFCAMFTWLQVHHLPGDYARTNLMVDEAYIPVSAQQMIMADRPDAGIWSDDERLALKFVKAAFTYEMTDELCEEAVTAWGAEWTITALALLNHYFFLNLLHETFGVTRVDGLDWSKPLVGQLMGAATEELLNSGTE